MGGGKEPAHKRAFLLIGRPTILRFVETLQRVSKSAEVGPRRTMVSFIGMLTLVHPFATTWHFPSRGNEKFRRAFRLSADRSRMTVESGAPRSRSRPRPSAEHKKRAAVSCSSFCSYSSTGYTLTCLLSLPRRSKAILPSAVAKSVSSLPILTFRPGWR